MAIATFAVLVVSVAAPEAEAEPRYGIDPALSGLIGDCRDPTTGETFACPPDDPNNPLKKFPSGICMRERTGRREACPSDPDWNQRQDARIAAEKAAQQAELAKRQAALEVARTKRDPGDVVEQILNYTTTGRDEGNDENFWFKPDATQPCIYQRASGVSNVFDLFAMLTPEKMFSSNPVDLNRLDINGLAIEYRGGEYKGANIRNPVTAVLTYDGQLLLSLGANADPERVKRGWVLIYEDGHCKGLKRAF